MCSLSKKCDPLFEVLRRTALAHSQAYLSFEVHLPFFPSNTDEADFVALLVLFASLSSRRWLNSFSDNVAHLNFHSAMTKSTDQTAT